MSKEIILEQVQEFMTMLTGGKLPAGMTMGEQPALTPQQAFSVIWFLQEHLRVLPDNIELCFAGRTVTAWRSSAPASFSNPVEVTTMSKEITLEQVQEFMTMLTGGELPEGMTMTEQPALTPRQAFSVIWFLQEHLRVLPDNIELCVVCAELFDADREGYIVADDACYQGAKFCSTSCEVIFWSDPEAYVRPAPASTFTEKPR